MGCSESRYNDPSIKLNQKKNSKKFQFEVYAAIKSNKIEIVKEFLKTCFDVNYKMPNFIGRTALHIAAEYGNDKIITLLLDRGADINALDFSGCPPLFLALNKGHLECVSILIEFGANLNIITNHELTFRDFIYASNEKESYSLLKHLKVSNQL